MGVLVEHHQNISTSKVKLVFVRLNIFSHTLFGSQYIQNRYPILWQRLCELKRVNLFSASILPVGVLHIIVNGFHCISIAVVM
jgi:hypothetical protein